MLLLLKQDLQTRKKPSSTMKSNKLLDLRGIANGITNTLILYTIYYIMPRYSDTFGFHFFLFPHLHRTKYQTLPWANFKTSRIQNLLSGKIHFHLWTRGLNFSQFPLFRILKNWATHFKGYRTVTETWIWNTSRVAIKVSL